MRKENYDGIKVSRGLGLLQYVLQHIKHLITGCDYRHYGYFSIHSIHHTKTEGSENVAL